MNMINTTDARYSSRARCSPLSRAFSVIETPAISLSPLRFLLLDCPTETTLPLYLDEFRRLNVTDVVRCCQATYNASRLTEEGINVLDLPFRDGGVPPANIIGQWLKLVETRDREARMNASTSQDDPDMRPTIAVHCVAGLGRAPVLVAIALIEMGMQPLDAIEYVRRKRRGAFNKPQIAFLDAYKRTTKSVKARSMTTSSASSASIKFSLGKMFRIGSSGSKKEVTASD
ncbi:protein-tyrosine phosphatase-like protein [Umbelopsis sp. PMI_123]|nr:protein-tyrosine phosphatase-like protein [Umbelopsis sp. PMI_123]